MSNIHPKVAASTVAVLIWTAVCLALVQYAPAIAPNASLSAAVSAALTALTGYFWPSGNGT